MEDLAAVGNDDYNEQGRMENGNGKNMEDQRHLLKGNCVREPLHVLLRPISYQKSNFANNIEFIMIVDEMLLGRVSRCFSHHQAYCNSILF